MQRAQELQRIAVTIDRAVRPAGDRRAETGHARCKRVAIEDFDRIPAESRLRLQCVEHGDALLELSCGDADVNAARLRKRDVDTGLAQKLAGEPRPLARRVLCPGSRTEEDPRPSPAPRSARNWRAPRDTRHRLHRAARASVRASAGRTRPRRRPTPPPITATSKVRRRSARELASAKAQHRGATSAPKSSQPWLPPPATYWNAPA